MNAQSLLMIMNIILILMVMILIVYYQKKIAQLQRLNKSLVKANKNYLDMLGFVSHELKGIMGSVIMCVYSVRDGFLGMMNFHQRKALDAVVRNLERLETTVKNYLDLSRIEKGELNVQKKEVILSEIMTQVKDTFIKPMAEKEMILEDKIPGDLKIFADPNQIMTVFNNLLSNAIKYGHKGGRIILDYQKKEELLRFSVYNDGQSISQKEKDDLFKKFYRASNGENKRVSGTGLGLFITKTIIESHGGQIWLISRKSGNEFNFEIKKRRVL